MTTELHEVFAGPPLGAALLFALSVASFFIIADVGGRVLLLLLLRGCGALECSLKQRVNPPHEFEKREDQPKREVEANISDSAPPSGQQDTVLAREGFGFGLGWGQAIEGLTDGHEKDVDQHNKQK